MRIHFVLAGLVLCSGGELAAQQPSQPVAAETHKNISVAFRFLTLGLGAEVGRLLTSHVSARVGANYFKFSTSKSQSNISYDASLKLHAVSVLIDLYPGQRGSFHFTGGIMTNPLTIAATVQPTSSGTFKFNATPTPPARSARRPPTASSRASARTSGLDSGRRRGKAGRWHSSSTWAP